MSGAEQILKRNESILATEMDGEIVMMSVDDGTYYSVSSGVGARIWELLEEPKDESQLVDAIQAEFDVEPDQCAQDVKEFVASMLEQKLLVAGS